MFSRDFEKPQHLGLCSNYVLWGIGVDVKNVTSLPPPSAVQDRAVVSSRRSKAEEDISISPETSTYNMARLADELWEDSLSYPNMSLRTSY